MKHIHKFRDSHEMNARLAKKSRLSMLKERIAQEASDVLEGILPSKVSQDLAMARQMHRENRFEPQGAPLFY